MAINRIKGDAVRASPLAHKALQAKSGRGGVGNGALQLEARKAPKREPASSVLCDIPRPCCILQGDQTNMATFCRPIISASPSVDQTHIAWVL